MPENKQPEKQIRVINLGQYTRSLNFEMKKTPYELSKLVELKPSIEFKLATKKKALDNDNHEITLQIEAVSNIEETKENIFKVVLEYSGIFKLEGDLTEEIKDEILLVNCVTLLFPFARQKLADVTLSGGYQPIMLDPIDFRNAFLQSKQQNRTEKLETLNTLAA